MKPDFYAVVVSLGLAVVIAFIAALAGFFLGVIITSHISGEGRESGLLVCPVLALVFGVGAFLVSFRLLLKGKSAAAGKP
jgi:hypothetical protein